MKRRDFIKLVGCGAAMWPLAARAQQQRVRRIGVLMTLAADDPETKACIAVFPQALGQLGWSPDRDVRVDIRFAPGSSERYKPLAQELCFATRCHRGVDHSGRRYNTGPDVHDRIGTIQSNPG